MNKDLVTEELLPLRKDDGTWDPQDVVDFAKTHPTSECHKHFNWNVSEAANAYWLQQARYLITTCVVIVREPTVEARPVRVFFREGKPEDEGEERASGYVSTEELLKTPDGRRKIIVTTVKRALGILNSYPLPELRPLITLAHKLLKKYQHAEEALLTK